MRRHAHRVWGMLLLVVLVLQAGCARWAPRGTLLGSHHHQSLAPPAAPKQLVTLTPGSNFSPVEVSEAEFREAFTLLVLEMPLQVTARPARSLSGRLVRVSWQPTDARGVDVERGYASLCERRGTPGDCFSFMGAGPHDNALSDRDRFRHDRPLF